MTVQREWNQNCNWPELSTPVEPGPDFSGEWNQRESILELERPLGGLVPEHNHAKQSTDPAAERTQHHEDRFGNAPA